MYIVFFRLLFDEFKVFCVDLVNLDVPPEEAHGETTVQYLEVEYRDLGQSSLVILSRFLQIALPNPS
jgi:hypothetical protein